MRVGFVGLGRMGSAMAANLLKAGHEVAVWNRSPDKAEALVQAGARHASSPRHAANADVVMTMLADDSAVGKTPLSNTVGDLLDDLEGPGSDRLMADNF